MNARLSFDAELESLSASLIRMGALATDAIDKAIEALEANDGALAQSVIAGDRNIDDMERSIEHQCLTLLLRQQPVAGDLRKISTAIKMITDIERIGDAAADIAEITTHIKEHGIPASLSDIADMAEAAQKMVDDSIQSYVREDLVLAADVIARDDVVDDYFNKIKKDLAAYIAVNEEHVDCAIDYLMIAKYLERIGDQAFDIADITKSGSFQGFSGKVHIKEMAKAAIHMVTDSVDSYVKQDVQLAKRVTEEDDVVDELFLKVRRELAELIHTDQNASEQALDLLMIAKYLERIGDHAVNVSEWVIYSVTGKHMQSA